MNARTFRQGLCIAGIPLLARAGLDEFSFYAHRGHWIAAYLSLALYWAACVAIAWTIYLENKKLKQDDPAPSRLAERRW